MSSQVQPGAARSSQEQPGAVQIIQGQLEAARSSQEQPAAARSSQKQLGTGIRTTHGNTNQLTSNRFKTVKTAGSSMTNVEKPATDQPQECQQ